ncbi:DUF3718 domain-containing protein [Alteromonadaceae bacterium M269]|nr:DUF3718 domain-containing protein [Alteromonadaceae bacterium M269]
MNKLLKASLIAATVTVATPSFAGGDINSALANICSIVKTNDKSALRSKMKRVEADFGAKLRDVYNGVTCGGESLIRTAMLSEAVDTGTFMIKKMTKRALTQPEQDGKTLSAWVTEKGLDGSPLAAVLKERI